MTRLALAITMISCLPPVDNVSTSDAESTTSSPGTTTDHTPTDAASSSTSTDTTSVVSSTTTSSSSTVEGTSTSGGMDTGSSSSTGSDSDTTSSDTSIDPDPNVIFVCCAGDDVMCTQGECTPFGYCPMECDITDPDDCGDVRWAVCAVVTGYRTPICVATFDACKPEPIVEDETTGTGPTSGDVETVTGTDESGNVSQIDYT